MKIILSGYQKASLNNLRSYFLFKKKKVLYIPSKFFSSDFIFKKKNNIISKKNFKTLKLFLKKKIILGTSETYMESNIGNFLNKKKIDYSIFIDSITNLKIRIKFFDSMPNKILVNNSLIKNKLLEIIKQKNIKIVDLKMPYQKYLKRKYSNIKRLNQYYLFVTSNLGIGVEKKFINKLINLSIAKGKKLKVLVHPRENLLEWKNEFYNLNIKFYMNKNFYNDKSILNVFGVSTMALVNFKFAGCQSYFFFTKKNDLAEIFFKYKVKPITL